MQRFRSLRRAAVVPVMALCLTFLLASGAQAAPFVDVTYDLGESTGTTAVLLPAFPDPIVFELSSEHFEGQQKIRYASDSNGNLGGAVSLLSFKLTVTAAVIYNYLPLADSTLTLEILNVPLTGGTLVGSTIDPQGGIGTFQVKGTQHCLNLCPVLGYTVNGGPIVYSVPTILQTVTFLQPLPTLYTTNNGTKVSGVTTAMFTLDPGMVDTATNRLVPVTAVTNIVGREISRQAVPEPGSLLLVGTALGSVAVAGIGRRFLRRR